MAYNISRKGCFKCGNRASTFLLHLSFPPPTCGYYTDVLRTTVGHIAENCTSQERLCYNCRKPGHESSSCTEPRSVAAKQCYSCGGIGHIQAECPTLRLQGSNQKCYVRKRDNTCLFLEMGKSKLIVSLFFFPLFGRIAATLGILRAYAPTRRLTVVLRRVRPRLVAG